jgi:hypothetical protein
MSFEALTADVNTFDYGTERRALGAWFSGLDTGAVFDQHGNQLDPAVGEYTGARSPRAASSVV